MVAPQNCFWDAYKAPQEIYIAVVPQEAAQTETMKVIARAAAVGVARKAFTATVVGGGG